MTSQARSADAHLEVGEVVGYLAGTLTSAEREWVEFHLADCADCTSEVVSAKRLYQANRAPVRRLAAVAAAAAVAASVAGIALLGPGLVHRGPAGTLPVRGAEPRPAVTVVLPADRAVLGAAPNFTWRAVPGATAYRILVSRPDGDSVWATTTSDTTVRGPEEVSRAGPGLYYWYVDVLLDDARSAAGLVHEFRIEP
jgi:hypothetical protein